jgi:hypothetical protein
VRAPEQPAKPEREEPDVAVDIDEPEAPAGTELDRSAAEAELEGEVGGPPLPAAEAPLADLQSLAEASGDLLPPEPEPQPAAPETMWTRLSRAILLLLLVTAASLAAGSYLLHQTLDPRPFLQDLIDLLMTP